MPRTTQRTPATGVIMRRAPVLFLHAFPLDARMWAPQVERFGGAAPTLYRLGGPSFEEWARAALAQVDGEVAVVGSSMGGYAALAAARIAPERVKALVLVGSRADADTPERRVARNDTIELLRTRGVEPLWERLHGQLFSPGAPREVVDRARAIALEQRVDDLVRATEAMRDRPDSTEVLRAFAGRLLVVAGDSDPFVPLDHFEGFVGPELLHVVQGGGHLVSLERPELVNALLADVLG